MASVLRFTPPQELGFARRIVALPAPPSEAGAIQVALRPLVQGVSEAGYDRFVKLVRQRFVQIESSFDADTGDLCLTAGRVLNDSSSSHGDPDHPTGGGVPAWLGALLEMGAVEKLTFRYYLIWVCTLLPLQLPVA